LLYAIHGLLANSSSGIGIGRVQPEFHLVDRMLTVRFVYNANSTHMRIVDGAIHDTLHQLLPILIQQFGWEIVFGVQLALTVGIFPVWKDTFLEETVFCVFEWSLVFLMDLGSFEKESSGGHWEMVKVDIKRLVCDRRMMRKQVGDFAGILFPLHFRFRSLPTDMFPENPFRSSSSSRSRRGFLLFLFDAHGGCVSSIPEYFQFV
jgi:hypothetical protein